VKVESGFRHRAVSPKGAIGFAQVRLPTARFYEPDITEERLKEPEVNLRIGFRFLKDLMKRFDGDLRVALLAYNRGPTRVAEILAVGEDPANGYSKAVLSGMRKK
jgi:soluble lytic murein transglycosylase-like protein